MRLVDTDAGRFIPGPPPPPVPPHAVRDELGVQPGERHLVQIKGEVVYKVTDVIDVTIAEVRMETRSIIIAAPGGLTPLSAARFLRKCRFSSLSRSHFRRTD